MGEYLYLLTAVALLGLVVLHPTALTTILNVVDGIVTGAFKAARGG